MSVAMLDRMETALLVGETDGGRCAVLVEEATWRTIASVADSLTAASNRPIVWTCHAVRSKAMNRALIEAGYGDVPVKDSTLPV